MTTPSEQPPTTKVERLAQALLADAQRDEATQRIGFFDRCFACGIALGKHRDGRFCTAKHRQAYDDGSPAWAHGDLQTRISYRFLIRCLGCDKEFASKGLRCCSIECERKRGEREHNRAIMAAAGMESAEKRHCLQCGTIIPKWTKGRRTPSSKRFCSDKCSGRHRRRIPAPSAEFD